MACGHSRKQMVFHMKKHIVSNAVFEQPSQRSRKRPRLITIVMDSPDGKERRKALPCRHRQDVITKPWDWDAPGAGPSPAVCTELANNPVKPCLPAFLPGFHVRPIGNHRPKKDGF